MNGIVGPMAALADATRARMLLLLDAHELTVTEIQTVLQLPQSTVSRHLKVLSDEDWLANRSEGASRYYRIAKQAPETQRRVWEVVRTEIAHSPEAALDLERARAVLERRRARSQEFFRTAAGQWDAVRGELFGMAPESGALLALLDPSWEVADLGCGTGQVSATVAPWVRRVIAVDGSEAMLTAARGRLSSFDNVELRRGELEAVPIAAASVDVALLFLVLHYLPAVSEALSEAHRILRPGGRVLIVDMEAHARAEYREQMGHVWLGFERDQLAAWLSEAGFGCARFGRIAMDPGARGPALVACVAARQGVVRDKANQQQRTNNN